MTALYIQAEEKGSSWQVWPRPDAIPAGAIRENTSYIFELRDCTDATNADLLIDDNLVEGLCTRQPDIARWRWSPDFHAGSVEVVLRLPGSGTRNFEITTDPDLRKLTRADFETMVRELLEDTMALFSLSAFRKGIGRRAGNRPPPLARLEFLRSRVAEILEAVDAIAKVPRHYLQPEEIAVPAHRAMRATGPEIIKSFRSGKIRMETGPRSRLPPALKGRLPAKINMRLRRNSVDIAEHRQIKACLVSWAAWLNNVADMLERVKPDDEEFLGVAANWAARTRRIARRLTVAADTPFMRQVGDGSAQVRMSSLFRRDPTYQRFYRLWQDMNLGLSALFGDFLQMPLARTFDLYELWCFLRLTRAAVEEYGSHGVDVSKLFRTDAAGGVTLTANAVVVQLGAGHALCFQRRYQEYWIEPDGEGSFSRIMVPDVVFSSWEYGSQKSRLIVMDAKYRIADNLNDALNSIHTYRDAIVREARTGETEAVVSAAYILTPHIPELAEDFRSTPLPGRLFHPLYRTKFQFGAATLRPGMTTTEIRTCLRSIVADAAAA